MKTLNILQLFLENLDSYRDKALFVFIKPYWPRKITPNHVTSIRVVISIVIIVLLFLGVDDKNLILILFVIGVFTDFIDGPIARGTNQVTELGAMLDSSSDRLLFIPILVYGLITYHQWLLITLIIVEFLNALTSLYYKSKEVYLESNIFGKIKMVLICMPLIAILFYWPDQIPSFFIYLFWATIPLSFLSALSKILGLKNKQHAT